MIWDYYRPGSFTGSISRNMNWPKLRAYQKPIFLVWDSWDFQGNNFLTYIWNEWCVIGMKLSSLVRFGHRNMAKVVTPQVWIFCLRFMIKWNFGEISSLKCCTSFNYQSIEKCLKFQLINFWLNKQSSLEQAFYRINNPNHTNRALQYLYQLTFWLFTSLTQPFDLLFCFDAISNHSIKTFW